MFNTIKINKRSWVALTEIQKEQLIFHELTHCLLDQDHDDLGLNVMNTHGFIYKQLYVEYYDYFIRRLFLECRKPLYEKFKYEEI
jgi:flagellin-specific chaperone FliS